MLNKNTLGIRPIRRQYVSRQVRPKALISAEAKKLLYQKSLNDIATIVYSTFFMIGFVTWSPFCTKIIIKVNHEKYSYTLYAIN